MRKGLAIMIGGAIVLSTAGALWLSTAAAADELIGLVCDGQTTWPASIPDTVSQEHFIVDSHGGKIIHRGSRPSDVLAEYALTIDRDRYRGERQEEGRTNGGYPIHRFDTVSISRDDGAIESVSHATTSFPDGPITQTTRFEGRCEIEAANSIVESRPPKF